MAIVIGAGALHAIWNAIAKYLDDRLVVFALIGVASTVGGGLMLAVAGLPYRAAIGFAAVSAAIHIGYDLGLMNSYRLGAFNQVYPIARGTSPLVVAFGAYFVADERLGAVPLAGVAILAAGLAGLALSSGRLTSSELPAIGAALLTGLAIAGYTIVDGLGVRRAHDPYAYAGLLFFLLYTHSGPLTRTPGLAARVRIVHVRSLPPSGACQIDHRPANENGWPSVRVMWNGCLGAPGAGRHS